ncbi:3'(2'),5'-bisphosphate nucleotidase CysQ [Sphingomonas qilianensis]|uniref:3'(2'),5-bisphosphonucleoside 3'(2')-phosphohydrolase n=1 Tax=Sphingomonas qilianensis TaxID=1736690 RepID=A0ABU9XT18_9SPHN
MESRSVNDAELARDIAEEAGRLLLAIRAEGREDGKALGVRGDHEANALILARLAAARPGDAILSEEAGDDRVRCACPRVWIVDPLDGTREYSEGRDDWAVHVALAVDRVPLIGAVALPAQGVTFDSGQQFATIETPRRPRMVVSRTRPPEAALTVARALDAELIPMGSAGAKAMAVVDGRADIYLHAGGQYEWDNCAPAAVAIAAGLSATRLDGAALVYNCEDPMLPDLLICRAELRDVVLAILAGT